METKTQHCHEYIHTNWTIRRCSRKGIIKHDGKFYCKQHDPITIAEKKRIKQGKFDKEYKECKRVNKLRNAAPDLLEALKEVTDFLVSGEHSGKMEIYCKCRRAIKKATE